MYIDEKILLGKGTNPVYLLPSMANRHGLIAGATGTGKTVTLKVMAEAFSDMGVPVFLADIKGDLGSLAAPGVNNSKLQERIDKLSLQSFSFKQFPVCFWDIFGEGGHPVRTTISEMGALLLSRLLGLNDTQTGILNIVFRIADDKKLLLIDIKDLRAMLQFVAENSKEFTLQYGNITSQSVGAILRSLVALEDQGGLEFFGEPAFDITDWMKTTYDGKGVINILHSVKLFQSPALYSTFLLWMLSELFETLPEEGDIEKPKLVFFFDEANLLFNDAPKILVEKIEQLARLIRSKGVGVYFITQNPIDLPENVLGQLGNRVQHALRAYTPAELKALKAAAQTFRANPAFDTEAAINELATGEALISCLDSEGRPGMVERAFVLPPQSLLGTIDEAARLRIINNSQMRGKYESLVDSESAFEVLQKDMQQKELQEKAEQEYEVRQKELAREERDHNKEKSVAGTFIEKAAASAMHTIGREVTRSIIRGILGSLKR